MAALAGSPLAALVDFSVATNLSIAGRGVRADPGHPALPLLRGFGARIVREGEAPDLVLDERLRLADGERRGASAVERIDFARTRMPHAAAAAARLGDRVRGLRIAVSLVLEPKTAALALLLQDAGAEVGVFAFAAETDPAVAAALASRGVAVHASGDDLADALALLDAGPRILVDDGAHVIRLAHRERPDVVAGMIGAAEETTSGVRPLEAMAADGALRVPVIAANDAVTKSWIDNRHGTGETCVLAIARVLGDDLAGVDAVVAGFGPVGEGVAERLAALGARTTVAEVDPRRSLAARYAGHRTAPLADAVRTADLVVSATGARATIDAAVLRACRSDAAIAVAGGAPEEVLLPQGTRVEALGPHVERIVPPDGPSVRLLAGGDCVNIVAGEGNPIDVMDLSFAVQLTVIGRLLDGGLAPGVHRLSTDADRLAAGGERAGRPLPLPDWRRTRFETR